MERVFVDTNIILDWLGERKPFFKWAKSLFRKAENGEIIILVSTMSFMTIEYILRKGIGKEKTLRALTGLRRLSVVCINQETEVDLALISDFKDFEDALQYYTAKNNLAKMFITRNIKDFKKSELPVMTAEEYLKL